MHLLRGRMQIPTCPSAQKVLAVTQECGQTAWAHEFLPACLLLGLCAQKGVYTAGSQGSVVEFAFF